MALFQRIKTPFAENGPEDEAPSSVGPRSAGDALRERREELALDLGHVAAILRIRPAYLEALEEGRPERLPGPTYAVGFVRAYSEHLGLDSAEILRRFKLEAAGLDAKPDLSFPMPLSERSVPSGAMLLAALVLTICGYGAWYYLSTGDRPRLQRVTEVPAALLPPKSEPPLPAPHAPVAAGASSATSTPAPAIAAPDTPGRVPGATDVAPAAVADSAPGAVPAAVPARLPVPEPSVPVREPVTVSARSTADGGAAAALSAPPPQADGSRIYGVTDGPARIVLRATADSWIQVRDANRSVVFTGLLKPGQVYRVPNQPGIAMRTGSAGGLEVTVDGNPAPPLGPIGAVRRDVALDPEKLAAGTAVR